MITRHGDASYTLVYFQYYEGISFVNELLNGNLLSGCRVFCGMVKLIKTLKIPMAIPAKRFAQCQKQSD
jgi:hypothetical protein